MQHVEHSHHEHHSAAHDGGGRHGIAHHGGGHAGAAHHGGGHAAGPASWRTAALATLHCLTGCAIGEVLGMTIGTALGWHNASTMALAIVLAFAFGYALTVRGVLRADLDLRGAVRVALAADTVSIVFMEIADNGTILLFPGAMDATLTDALFWYGLAAAFAVAFLVTTPVNKWMIGRGKGHAVVHGYH
ncbi:DUF4396 domain-containing protein [Streptomyces sp. ME03-5709C]|nr:DUF4396 domain-containing protein [Streptomyces sp. ME03-5709C]